MLGEMMQIELIGFVAGLTNLVSSVPQLVANLRNPSCAAKQSGARNLFQMMGNGLWLIYGVAMGSVAMTTFSTLGCAMAALLFIQVQRARNAGMMAAA